MLKARNRLFNNANKLKKKRDKNKRLLDDIKSQINNLKKLIRNEIDAIKSNEWLKFCKTIDKTKKNSRVYWKKIKKISKLENYENSKHEERYSLILKHLIF